LGTGSGAGFRFSIAIGTATAGIIVIAPQATIVAGYGLIFRFQLVQFRFRIDPGFAHPAIVCVGGTAPGLFGGDAPQTNGFSGKKHGGTT
jgi:hypothetical protein